MKFAAFLLTFFAVLAATVSAAETNAQRLARGLNPLPPVRRATGTDSAPQHHPSGTPPSSYCSTGEIQCCNTVSNSADPFVHSVASAVDAKIPGANVPVGLGCTPLKTLLGLGQGCSQQTVCCKNNKFKGLIAVGCSPVTVL